MSIFEPSVFFNSLFAESATFYADLDPETEPLTITVVVNRDDPKESTFKNSNVQSVSYPLTVDIKKSDVATITKNVSKLKIRDLKYVEQTLFIKDVVYADEFIWRVAV